MPGPSTANVVNNAPIVTGTANQITATYSGTPPTTATIALASNVVNTSQPLFSSHLTTTQTNVTGDNTVYPVIYDATTSNQGAHYNTSTGIFTAPIDGNYFFITENATIGNGAFGYLCNFLSSLVPYQVSYVQLQSVPISDANISTGGSAILALTAGATVQVTVQAQGSGSAAVSIVGSSSPIVTYFCGYLMP